MPVRTTPLVTDQYYHVFNRGVEKRLIFSDKRDYRRLLTTISFYQYSVRPCKLSFFLKLANKERQRIMQSQKHKQRLVTVLCYVFMPNHFHLLVRQEQDEGISKFIKDIANSYTRYFNTKHDRIGPLLQGQFKAVHIVSDEQLLHLSRYIHLNPYTSFVLKTRNELLTYQWSSLPIYIDGVDNQICETSMILAAFSPKNNYREFVLDHADYQRRLESIQHLTIE